MIKFIIAALAMALGLQMFVDVQGYANPVIANYTLPVLFIGFSGQYFLNRVFS